jgi:hypothetical protein
MAKIPHVGVAADGFVDGVSARGRPYGNSEWNLTPDQPKRYASGLAIPFRGFKACWRGASSFLPKCLADKVQ